MLGLSSLREIDAYVEAHWGVFARRGMSLVLLLGILGISLAGIAAGFSAVVKPLAVGGWTLLSGAPRPALSGLAVPLLSVGAFLGLGYWVNRRLKSVMTGHQYTEEWLNGPLEIRLKALRDDIATLQANVPQTWTKAVTDELFDINKQLNRLGDEFRARLVALENHTDIHGLVKLLAEREVERLLADNAQLERIIAARSASPRLVPSLEALKHLGDPPPVPPWLASEEPPRGSTLALRALERVVRDPKPK